MADLSGRNLDHYRLDAMLGEGGMGIVYRGSDLNLLRDVAVKVMHPHLARQPQFKERFLQEARAAARLDHPSIVKIFDFGDKEGYLYTVMEYVRGGSLGSYLQQLDEEHKFPQLEEVLHLLSQVSYALGYAHQEGVIHRDVKPDNILLKRLNETERETELPLRAVVTDFGLAKLLDGGIQTATGTFMGTLPYMSPEQALGHELDGRSDLYSLGVILYQLTTGCLPLDIKSPTDAVRKHLQESPPPPQQLRPELPQSVAALVAKAVAKSPQDRFPSGHALARSLRRVSRELTQHQLETFAEVGSIHSLITVDPQQEQPPEPSQFDAPPVESGPAIVVGRKGQAPRTIRLEGEQVTIGRARQNDIVLAGPDISREHARLEKGERGWFVGDLDSRNGTYLDGRRLEPFQPYEWVAPKVVRVGPFYLRWQQVASVSEAATVVEPPPAVAIREPAQTVVRPRQDGTRNRNRLIWLVPALILLALIAAGAVWVVSQAVPSDDPAAGVAAAATAIRQGWSDGFSVATLAGGQGYWALAMSKPASGQASVRQTWVTEPTFPREFVRQNWQDNYSITSVGYEDGLWAVVMTARASARPQTWTTEAQFPRDFVSAGWEEGLAITNVAYGNGLWAIVMTRADERRAQNWLTSEEFPAGFIRDRWEEGFAITSLSHGNGVWAVVATQQEQPVRQTWNTHSAFPIDFIEEKWSEGLVVEQIAFGDDLWAVVMGQPPQPQQQTYYLTGSFSR